MSYDIVRAAAVNTLLRVRDKGAYVNAALDRTLSRADISERGRAFLTQLVYGTVRHQSLCDHVLRGLLTQPLEKLPGAILIILRMGVFQSLFCRSVTFPSMVHTSVELAKHRGHAGTTRLVNAVLRRAPQRMEDVPLPPWETHPADRLSVRYSLPPWITKAWLTQFGSDEAARLCAACNEEAPVSVRANLLQTSTDTLMALFEKAKCGPIKGTRIPEELTLTEGLPPSRSKLFREGQYFIQDAASMLPPHALDPQPGETILDLCAAPGGKTTHIAQLAHDKARVVAMDIHPDKLRFVRENAERLGCVSIRTVCGNGAQAPFGEAFDRVLIDAPCSGLGTIRRHPDLKWRVTPEAIARLAVEQQQLLRSAIRLCKNGGTLVYSVCTFTPEETEEALQAALATGEVVLEDGPEWLDTWKTRTGTYRTLPHVDGLDGFFLMRLRKAS